MANRVFSRLSMPPRPWLDGTACWRSMSTARKKSQTAGVVDVSKKKSNKKSLVTLHMENQQLFGNLLETSDQRKKRLTKVAKAAVTDAAAKPMEVISSSPKLEKEDKKVVPKVPRPKPSPLRDHLKLCQESVRNGVIPREWDSVQIPLVFKPKDLPGGAGDESVDICSEMPPELKRQLPSVTRVLSETMSPESKAVLEAWKQRMIEKMGLEEFQQMQRDTLERGKLLHAFILNRLLRLPEKEPEPVIVNYVKSLRPVLPAVKDVNVELSERPVYHPFLGYWGIPDCVASYKGTPVLVDWKTSQRTRRTVDNLYDGPLQLAAYIGAMNALHPTSQMDHGLVVVAYESGSPADVHVFSKRACEGFWRKWVDRLKLYRAASASRNPVAESPVKQDRGTIEESVS